MAMVIALAPAALADSTTYSGTGLAPSASVSYSSLYSGDAQYVAGTPDVAQLLTADSGTSSLADSPAVYISGSLGTLDDFSASYDLYSSSVPSGTSPYFILYLTDDPTYSDPIVADGGSTLNASSLVHVGDLTSGSITLADLTPIPGWHTDSRRSLLLVLRLVTGTTGMQRSPQTRSSIR
jgi:hypothetical protein